LIFVRQIRNHQIKKMKKLLSISIITLLFLSVNSLKANEISNRESETRTVKNFHAITSGGSFNVYVKIGTTESLKIEGSSEDLQRISTIVQNGMLKISYKRDANNWNTSLNKVNIYITAVKLDGLILSGSGLIELDGKMSSASADIRLSGSGKIKANIDTQSAEVALSGSGELELGGKTGVLTASISGSGELNALDLIADSSTINVVGSGSAYVNAKENLKANLMGSGNVKYKGNPEVTISKVGSGNVSKME
jgi:hypothetical protein